MKKITAFIATLILLIGTLSISAFGADGTKTVTLRIEGKSKTYFYEKVTTSAATVEDLMKEINTADNGVTVTMTDSQYGAYISKINDDAENTAGQGSFDGWSDVINGAAPSVGISAQEIKDGDEIVFYYGDEFGSHGFAVPIVDVSKINEGIIKLTSNGFDANYSPVVNPVAGATVKWDDSTYTTDDNGVITLKAADAKKGAHAVAISKVAEDGMPLVLRTASDYKITLDKDADVPTGYNSVAIYGVIMAVAACAVVATRKKAVYEK